MPAPFERMQGSLPDVARSSGMRTVLRIAGFVLAVLSFAFLGFRLLSELEQLPPLAWTGIATGAMLAAIGLVVAIEAVHSLAWRTLARAIDPRVTWRESFALCGRSQIAKYLPGNVFHYVQRVVLAREDGIGAVEASGLAVVDAVLLAVTGVVVGLPALRHGLQLAAPFAFLTSPIAGFVVVTAVLVGGGLLLARPEVRARIRQLARVVAPRRLVGAVLLDTVPFVMAGVTVHLVLHGFWPGVAQLGWLDFIPGFALAFVVGFATPGAPGGVGVREMVLYLLYAPALGGGLAAALFLLLRVAYILGDTATFVAASWIQSAQPGRTGARADTP